MSRHTWQTAASRSTRRRALTEQRSNGSHQRQHETEGAHDGRSGRQVELNGQYMPSAETAVPMVQPIASRGPMRPANRIAVDRRHDEVAEHQQDAGDRDRRVTTKPNDA